jgi:pilus assembly protein Flp/PilA
MCRSSNPFSLSCREIAMKLVKGIRKFVADEQGTETLEWGLVCGLIVVGAIAAIALIGPKVKTMWDQMNAAIP